MNLQEIERQCNFYRRTRMLGKEKLLLEKTLSNSDFSNWGWGIQRMQELNPSFVPFDSNVEPDQYPTTKEEISQLSYQYQKEWRFEREKRLITHALTLFSDWKYLHQRVEWHSRPMFHREPAQSKTQPRTPLNLPRNPLYTPQQETIDTMCFVTGTDSQPVYFDLCIQMIESIKATRWYKDVPIKVLDCGLNLEDKNYLIQRFNAEVKDPGWDIDPNLVNRKSAKWSYNGWKGIVARPYIHKHFPGYQYYFWVDADLWVQDEHGLDHLTYLCEKYGLGIPAERVFTWPNNVYPGFVRGLPSHYIPVMHNKTLLHGGIYCISIERSQRYADYCDQAIQEKKSYLWGFDMAMINYFFYKEVNAPFIIDSSCFTLPHFEGVRIDENKNLIGPDGVLVGIMCLPGQAKHFPYHFLFTPNQVQITPHNLSESEEQSHKFCKNYNGRKGNIFYRIYPEVQIPEQ